MTTVDESRARRLTRCVYWAMRHRCESQRSPQYPNYGARGIRVCERWITPDAFVRDMGHKPSGMSIERIDVDGDYSPENCRWATRKEQANNTRRNARVTAWGTTKTAAEWSEITGVNRQVIANRINRLGWPCELAVIAPAGLQLRRVAGMQRAIATLPALLAAAGVDRKGRKR